jgi:flagellar basal body-associated protein FliL
MYNIVNGKHVQYDTNKHEIEKPKYVEKFSKNFYVKENYIDSSCNTWIYIGVGIAILIVAILLILFVTRKKNSGVIVKNSNNSSQQFGFRFY